MFKAHIDMAMDSEEAVEKIRLLKISAYRQYDLILIDFDINSKSGIQSLRKIRKIHSEYEYFAMKTRPPYIVGCMSFNDERLKEAAL